MKVGIVNGPNLNLLGKREKAIYGNISFDAFLKQLESDFPSMEINYFQSNVEGDIINKLHELGFSYNVILLNAGGYTHTSVALADAVAAIETPVIEIHISNIYAREEFRQRSLISPNCKAVVCGFGLDSYRAALTTLM